LNNYFLNSKIGHKSEAFQVVLGVVLSCSDNVNTTTMNFAPEKMYCLVVNLVCKNKLSQCAVNRFYSKDLQLLEA